MSPVLKSSVASIEIHLMSMNKPGMSKIEVRKLRKERAKRNGIIIVQRINIETLLRMGRDCQMTVICRRLSNKFRDTSDKTNCNQKYTLYH